MADKNKLILGTNDDTYIAGDDAGNIVLQHEAGQRVSLTSDAILPAGNETLDLGGPENKFRDLYLSSNSLYVGNTKITSDPATGALSTAVSDGAGGFSAPAAIGGGGVEQIITEFSLNPITISGDPLQQALVDVRIGAEEIYNYLIDNNISSSKFGLKLDIHSYSEDPETQFTDDTFKFSAFTASTGIVAAVRNNGSEFSIKGDVSGAGVYFYTNIGNITNAWGGSVITSPYYGNLIAAFEYMPTITFTLATGHTRQDTAWLPPPYMWSSVGTGASGATVYPDTLSFYLYNNTSTSSLPQQVALRAVVTPIID